MEQFTKTAVLKDGTEVLVRPMVREDEAALRDFFLSLPDDDRLSLKDDVSDPTMIARWAAELNYDRILPLLAFKGDKVVGDATLHQDQAGWFRHVGEIRCVVAKEAKGKGLAKILTGEIVRVALSRGLPMLQARMTEDQTVAIKVFSDLGFKRAAVLPNFVMDISGKRHNLVVMVNDTEDLWRKFSDLMMDLDFKRMG